MYANIVSIRYETNRIRISATIHRFGQLPIKCVTHVKSHMCLFARGRFVCELDVIVVSLYTACVCVFMSLRHVCEVSVCAMKGTQFSRTNEHSTVSGRSQPTVAAIFRVHTASKHKKSLTFMWRARQCVVSSYVVYSSFRARART